MKLQGKSFQNIKMKENNRTYQRYHKHNGKA